MDKIPRAKTQKTPRTIQEAQNLYEFKLQERFIEFKLWQSKCENLLEFQTPWTIHEAQTFRMIYGVQTFTVQVWEFNGVSNSMNDS